MSRLRRNARGAKVMLGETGTLPRVAAVATVFEDQESADWVVSSIDSSGDGGVYTVIFSGPLARERAVEYASEKYSGLLLRESDLPTYL
jgi:hypothetical protein